MVLNWGCWDDLEHEKSVGKPVGGRVGAWGQALGHWEVVDWMETSCRIGRAAFEDIIVLRGGFILTLIAATQRRCNAHPFPIFRL